MTKKLLLFIALLCAVVQGALAQNSWEEVYALTQTTSGDWTAINSGSTSGQTLGSTGNTTYYYVNSNLSFTNSNVGGSGLKIQGTVYLYVPEGVTITCTGANASGTTGAGAGIELASGNTLYLLGSGTVNATGGNAANGGDGGNGDHSYFVYDSYCQPGNGGNGGNGGGGAGAGIGTRGGNGGNGGSGATAKRDESEGTNIGVAGSAGNAGTTAGAMGNLYVVTSFVNLNASGGSAGSGGSGGARGNNAAEDPYNQYNASGGGGGGAGGFGGAASNIGTGGPGGGGGGGGAAGNSAWRANATNGFYRVGAGGGNGGKNGDGSSAANGVTSLLTNPYNAEYKQGLSGDYDDDGWEDGNGMYSGGSGASAGSASTSNNGTNISIVNSGTTTMTSGIYTILTDVTVPSRIQISGNVTLNLCEGATLHAPKGIEVSDINNNELTINGPGALTIDNCETGKSGIGANRVGTIIINGGTINVAGGPSAAGIGGDIENIYGGNITINGGVVNAVGGYHAAGIGGGRGRMVTNASDNIGLCGTININGGQVTASGGGNGPGIGPGYAWQGYSSGNLTFQWTNREEDFVYSTGYVTGVEPEITLNSITFAKQFIIEGTATIATSSNIGGQKIVPYATEQIPLSGEGTQGNPWRITSTADWNAFAQNVINGNSYSEQYVELMADIDITRGVGANDSRPFSGTFLGNDHTLTVNLNGHQQGTAPFICIGGATIKNLNVAGSITSHEYYTSGLVGFAYGTNLIEGCIVTATINQNNDYAGGFVGHGKTSATTIKDCIFSGTINGSDAVYHSIPGGTIRETTHNVGGIWCYGDEGSALTIQNCLEKGIFTTIDGMHPIGLQNGTADVTDTYYLTPQSGSLSHPVINGAYRVYAANTFEGEMLKPLLLLDGNTYYTCCLITIDDYYQCAGGFASVPPVVTAFDGTPLAFGTDYTVTLNGEAVAALPLTIYTGGIYTLVFTGMGNYIGSKAVETYVLSEIDGTGSASEPYIISSTEQWDTFAYYVNNDKSYSGEFVRLDADIDVSETVGFRNDHPFSGTFLGNSHTIRVNISSTATGTGANEQGVAPFHYIKDATIKDLTVAGSIASASYHTSGLVGFADGTNLIENCIVTATLDISSDYAGGIVGHGLNSATTIEGCVFAGTINAIGSNDPNVGGIWGWSDSGTPTLVNCLEAGTYNNVSKMHPMGLQKAAGTITGCYYVNPQVGSPSNACTVNGSKHAYTFATTPANLGDAGTDYGMVKAYANGILFDGKYYVPSTGNISRTVEGYGYETGKWAFIASPVEESIAPSIVTNLLGTKISDDPVLYDYDLYRLNPSTVMWENYNNSEHQAGFNIVNGQGYLYATKETKTLVFSGTFNTENSKTVGLSDGFNLVGNPFVVDAYVSKPFYQMNAEGTEIVPIDSYYTYSPITIPPCYGVVVSATGTDEVTFSTEMPTQQSTNNGNLQMTLTKADVRSDAFQDKAIVSFNADSKLEKFIFNENHAKLYIPQDGNDYAIAFSEMTGEVPLNFRATETGRYTIGFNFENVKGVRIQLIDKLEGSIIELNSNDSYTFMGSTADRDDRFTLVFTQVETGSIFAYQSGDDIIVSGEGELQVFDVMGRMVMNQHINGVQTFEKPSQTGVYIFKLNAMTQKIVVR